MNVDSLRSVVSRSMTTTVISPEGVCTLLKFPRGTGSGIVSVSRAESKATPIREKEIFITKCKKSFTAMK